MKQKTFFRILFLLYIAGMMYLCFGHFENAPSIEINFLGIPTDKLVHFGMFFPFPVLAFLAFDPYTETKGKTFLCVGVTLLIGLLIAFGTEWGQASLTDYRSGDPLDFLADSIGLFLGSVLVACWDICKQKS